MNSDRQRAQQACRCAYLPYPHKRNLNCDMLKDDEDVGTSGDDYEEKKLDERERARDMAAELNRGKR